MNKQEFDVKTFTFVVLLTSIWIHISEVFRYFVLVIPRVKSYWNYSEAIADMNWRIFGIWGIWDMVLTAMCVFTFWLYSQRFGNTNRSVVYSALFSWIFFFVLFWVGAANMGYSDWSMLWITLPLSLFELIIANFIASKLYKRFEYAKV
ncbi:hypothetical protein [Aquimarina litoralis]|uniref:hypothetical protein n=1 Tax=Aquimarina litoralis TaxID=584605 RepID=UPI001C5A01BD|nr:hypothetical protein [Aquimarina litoralis]MBW1294858.1 hypothetical protein [Aquimarina litoralis]